MGSQRDQTADARVQEGLMDSTKKSDAAAEGFYQRLQSHKIRSVYFLLITVVSLILLIAVIVLAATWPGDKMTEEPMDSPTAKETNAGEKMTEEPMDSPTAKATDSDHYYKIKKYLCGDIEQESSGCSVCLAGWLPHRESCYYFSPGKESKTWNKSRETCERMGADLLIIEDAAEKEFIDGSRKGLKDKVFWIGLYRDGNGWREVNGQPYNTGLFRLSGGSSGDCVGLPSGGEFYEDKCTNTNSWICEKRALKI